MMLIAGANEARVDFKSAHDMFPYSGEARPIAWYLFRKMPREKASGIQRLCPGQSACQKCTGIQLEPSLEGIHSHEPRVGSGIAEVNDLGKTPTIQSGRR